MKAFELQSGFYNPANDKVSQSQMHDTRKPRLTLVHLVKLRNMRIQKQLENLQKKDFLELIYGAPTEQTGPGL